MQRYYSQRATAGLIITDGSQISTQGIGYPATPGIHDEAQVAGWRAIADAVAFGILFLANPDLVQRLRGHTPLNEPDMASFYGGDTDYPALEPE